MLQEFNVSDLRTSKPMKAAQQKPVLIRHMRDGDLVLMSRDKYLELERKAAEENPKAV